MNAYVRLQMIHSLTVPCAILNDSSKCVWLCDVHKYKHATHQKAKNSWWNTKSHVYLAFTIYDMNIVWVCDCVCMSLYASLCPFCVAYSSALTLGGCLIGSSENRAWSISFHSIWWTSHFTHHKCMNVRFKYGTNERTKDAASNTDTSKNNWNM